MKHFLFGLCALVILGSCNREKQVSAPTIDASEAATGMNMAVVDHLLSDQMYLHGGPRYTLLPGEILHANREELDALLPRLLNQFDRIENCLVAWAYRMSEIDPDAARRSITKIRGYDRDVLALLRATVVYVEGRQNPQTAFRYFLDHYDEIDSANAGYFRGSDLIASFVFLDAQKNPKRYESTDDEVVYEVLEGYTLAMIYTDQTARAIELLGKYQELGHEFAVESIIDVLAEFWPHKDAAKARGWAETQSQPLKEDVLKDLQQLAKFKLTPSEAALNLRNQIDERLDFTFLEQFRQIVRMDQKQLEAELRTQRVQYQQMTASLIVHQLAKIDAKLCTKIIEGQDIRDQWITTQSYLQGIAYAQLVKSQPMAAARGYSKLLREPLPITSGGLRGNYAYDVAYTFCYELAKADSQLALKVGGKKWKYPHSIGGNEGQGVARAIIEKGEVMKLIDHFKTNLTDWASCSAYSDLAQAWPQLDAKAALEWFSQKKFDPRGDGEDVIDNTFYFAQGMAYRDPNSAIRFLQTQPNIDPDVRDKHLKDILGNANPHLAWRLKKDHKLKIKLD